MKTAYILRNLVIPKTKAQSTPSHKQVSIYQLHETVSQSHLPKLCSYNIFILNYRAFSLATLRPSVDWSELTPNNRLFPLSQSNIHLKIEGGYNCSVLNTPLSNHCRASLKETKNIQAECLQPILYFNTWKDSPMLLVKVENPL